MICPFAGHQLSIYSWITPFAEIIRFFRVYLHFTRLDSPEWVTSLDE